MNREKKQRFQPEVKLLLSAARRGALDNQTGPEPAFDFENIDWSTVVRLASHHRLLPFIYQYQTENDFSIPPEVQDVLNERFDSHVRRNLYMVSELLEVVDTLEDEGVHVLAYKGPTLAELSYGDVTLREFVDLDFLVPEREFSDAIEILCDGNYTIEESFPTFGETMLREQDTGLVIDLHFSVTPDRYPFRFSFDRLWRRRVTVSLCGGTVQTFSPPDLLAVVAVHATKHFWIQLEWLISFTALIQHESIDLSQVLQRSKQIGCDRMVLLGLHLSQELLGLTFPEKVSTTVNSNRVVQMIAKRIISRTVKEDTNYRERSRVFHYERYLTQLYLLRGLRARATYAFRIGSSFIRHNFNV